MSAPRPARARRVDVSEQTPPLDTLPGPHYASAWEIVPSHVDTRSAEQWARSTFEDAPTALRTLILAGWTAGLGLQLGPRPSPDHVLGWKINQRTPRLVIFGVRARMIGHAQFVLQTDSSRVLLTNFVRYETPWARPLWAAVQPLHHQILPYLLTHAASHPGPTLS